MIWDDMYDLEYLRVETYGSLSGITIERKITINENCIICEERTKSMERYSLLQDLLEEMKDDIEKMSPEEVEERIENCLTVSKKIRIKTKGIEQWLSDLRKTGFEKWEKENYSNPNIIDGGGWRIQYKIRKEEASETFHGNIFPDRWNDFEGVIKRIKTIKKET